MFRRNAELFVRWSFANTRRAALITAAISVVGFVLWWAVFGLVVAIIIEGITIGWAVTRWRLAERRRAHG